MLEKNLASSMEEMNVVAEMINDLIAENSRVAQDQKEYQKRYEALTDRYEEAEKKHEAAEEKIKDKRARKMQMEQFIKELNALPNNVTEFSPSAWGALVDFVTVYADGEIGVTLRNGMEIHLLAVRILM